MREFNVQEDFPVSVVQFFDLFFLSPKSKLDFHVKRGDTEISVGDWKELGTNKCERAIKFCSPVSDQAILKKLTGGMSPVVHEKQDYELIDNRELRVKSEATSSAGGFNCATTTSYTITELPPRSSSSSPSSSSSFSSSSTPTPACHVDIVVKSEFKSRLFKSQVENMMNTLATQTIEHWINLVKERVADFQKEERAKHKLPNHPHQANGKPEFLTDALASISPFSSLSSLSSLPGHHHAQSPTATEPSEFDDTDDDSSYYDAQDQPFTSPSSSRTSTPPPMHFPHHPLPPSLVPPSSTSSSSSGGLTALIHSIQKEIQQLRSMTEVNASRLLGLETSNYPPSSSSSSLPSGNKNGLLNNEGLVPYLQRLDVLAKQQEEEITRSREREQEWKRKYDELAAKVESGGGNGGKKLTVGWWGVVFILVWPVVAHKLWKYARILHPVVARAFWQLLGRK